MQKEQPNFLQIIRAPFLSSILAPIFAGGLLAAGITGNFSVAGFILVTIMGLALHTATNVYNDIYDTLQGTDRVNLHRNEFSGGSGLIIRYPEILPSMYRIARVSLVLAFLATAGLMTVVEKNLWPHLWLLYLLSAFFSKYYTAAPVKLASRGLGEVSVWFAFGPMAILVAAVSQNLGVHPLILLAMPVTGISTLSILLLGQMIDQQADRQGGKWGIAVRVGTRFTAIVYGVVQLILMINITLLSIQLPNRGVILLICLAPYLLLFPGILPKILAHHHDPTALQPLAKKNVQLHLLFSGFLVLGLLIYSVF